MFVLPPPPTYSTARLYGQGGVGGLIETNNLITRPEGPEHNLVLGEGTYKLRDEILLATPPPHPSEVPAPNNNPLATEVAPITSGTKLYLTPFTPKRKPSHGLYRLPTATSMRSNLPQSIPEEKAHSVRSDGESQFKGNGADGWSTMSTPTFGGDNPALSVLNGDKTKGAIRKNKPKNNIVKSNSSFVSRVIPHEAITKRLAERHPDGLFAFANISRAVQWLDLSVENKTENLTKILFTKANVLCQDVNEYTKNKTNMDILFGFNTSDIIWYEPISQKYTRINKNGSINRTPVTCIAWLPGHEHLFLAAHADGALIVYDRDKEDAPFVPEDAHHNGDSEGFSSASRMDIKKSVQSREQKTNPVSYWNLGRSQINNVAFSPDGSHLAVVSEDGTLKILDFMNETLLDVYKSYYGGLLSVTWSPDGRYILTGGQDDLVSIWSFTDSTLVARCPGHSSWVVDVKFDPWRCDERSYRFGSIGEDRKLLLWDFSVGMLGKPKGFSIRRPSVTSYAHRRHESLATVADEEGAVLEPTETNGLVHGVKARSATATLPPVMSKQVDEHPLSWLGFEEDCIVVACHDGHIKTWDRPTDSSLTDGLTVP